MTKHVVRIYALTLSVLVLFLTWATVAAHPWSAAASAPKDQRLVALARREAALHRRAAHVQLILNRRYRRYNRLLAVRRREIAVVRRTNTVLLARARAATAQAQSAASASYATPSVTYVSVASSSGSAPATKTS